MIIVMSPAASAQSIDDVIGKIRAAGLSEHVSRGTERTRHVPIIFITAVATDETRRFRGYETGAVDFIFKPVDPVVMRSKAKVFFDIGFQQQALQS